MKKKLKPVIGLSILTLVGLTAVVATQTNAGFLGTEFKTTQEYKVDNPIIDDNGYSFDNVKMEKFYSQAEKEKNFIHKTVSLGSIDLHNEVSKKLYDEHSYLYFLVDENKNVYLAPVVVTGKNKKPTVTNITLGKDVGAICSTEKETVYWTGYFGAGANTWQEKRPSNSLECMYFSKEANNWQPPTSLQEIYYQ